MSLDIDASSPLIVAVGGLDSTGGAGLVRDFITARALGARTVLIPTAFTLQGGAHSIEPRSADSLRHDLEAALNGTGSFKPAAIKVGMIASESLIEPLVRLLSRFAGPVVYDPVLAASDGGPLYRGELTALQPLIGEASLVTPNLGEAAALTGLKVTDLETARVAAGRLRSQGAGAVLVKGGHLPGEPVDLLVHEEGDAQFPAPRIDGKDPRGTGCALATAIAVGLARGLSLRGAVREAKRWLHTRIEAAELLAGAHWL